MSPLRQTNSAPPPAGPMASGTADNIRPPSCTVLTHLHPQPTPPAATPSPGDPAPGQPSPRDPAPPLSSAAGLHRPAQRRNSPFPHPGPQSRYGRLTAHLRPTSHLHGVAPCTPPCRGARRHPSAETSTRTLPARTLPRSLAPPPLHPSPTTSSPAHFPPADLSACALPHPQHDHHHSHDHPHIQALLSPAHQAAPQSSAEAPYLQRSPYTAKCPPPLRQRAFTVAGDSRASNSGQPGRPARPAKPTRRTRTDRGRRS